MKTGPRRRLLLSVRRKIILIYEEAMKINLPLELLFPAPSMGTYLQAGSPLASEGEVCNQSRDSGP